jgi:hypothetical protein
MFSHWFADVVTLPGATLGKLRAQSLPSRWSSDGAGNPSGVILAGAHTPFSALNSGNRGSAYAEATARQVTRISRIK